MPSYRSLFIELERALGKVLLPVDRDATEPVRLISSSAAFLDLTRSVAETVYVQNCCRTLHDPVELFPTLDALGKVKCECRTSDTLDVVAAEFLERVGETVIWLFSGVGSDTYEISTKSPTQAPLRGAKKVREA